MKLLKSKFVRIMKKDIGQTLIEYAELIDYALLLLLIACIVIVSVALTGKFGGH